MDIAQKIEEITGIAMGELKGEDELRLILKRRLTKKEYKIFFLSLDGEERETIREKILLSEERYVELEKRISQKLKSDKTRSELLRGEEWSA
jgi:hypothetical protein